MSETNSNDPFDFLSEPTTTTASSSEIISSLQSPPTPAAATTTTEKSSNNNNLDDFLNELVHSPTPSSATVVESNATQQVTNDDIFGELTVNSTLSNDALPPLSPPTTATASDPFSIDDFLAEAESSSTTKLQVSTSESSDVPREANPSGDTFVVHSNSESDLKNGIQDNDEDFLLWLGDSKSSPAKGDSGVSKNVVDDFFEEVFGDDLKSPKSLQSSSNSDEKKYENEIEKQLNAVFPDMGVLKSLLLRRGFIPRLYRGKIWNLLLTQSSNEDEEAEFWRPNGLENVNTKEMDSDCDAAIKRVRGTPFHPPAIDQSRIDLQDILILYCLRKKTPYKPYLCDLLAPMIVSPYPFSRAVASSCFYAFATQYIPYINLQHVQYDRAMSKLHSLMRLLLWYHFPLLAHHLDRVYAGWEVPAVALSASAILQHNNQQAYNASLDELERQMGLLEDSEPDIVAPGSPQTSSLGTSLPKSGASYLDEHRQKGGGAIPSLWLSGIFGGTVPPIQTSWFWDWAIINNERNLGIYATVTLLGIYSTALLSMSEAQIITWIQKVVSGGHDWYKAIPISLQNIDQKNLSWESFCRGWLHATVALKKSTPVSFRETILETENWVLNTDEIEEGTVTSDDHSHEENTNNSFNSKLQQAKAVVGAKGSKILHSVRRFSKKLNARAGSESEGDLETYEHVMYPHDLKKSWHALWASSAEVIPCLCSNQKNSRIPMNTMAHFEEGFQWAPSPDASPHEEYGGEGMCFPKPNHEKPFYFGIDIRCESELNLGRFPKAFALDPKLLLDAYDVVSFLETLAPLAETAHLCIIGVGEEYVRQYAAVSSRYTYASNLTGLNDLSPDAIKPSYSSLEEEAVTEYTNLVNHVASFLMMKGFQHISILDGGFTAAVRYLLRDDSPFTLGNALVDVDPVALDKVLGLGTCEKHLGARRHTDESQKHERQNTSHSSTDSSFSSLFNSQALNVVGSFVASLGTPKNEEASGKVFEDIGKKFSMFGSGAIATLKKGVGVVSTTSNTSAGSPHPSHSSADSGTNWKNSPDKGSPTFVIDDDEDENSNNTGDDIWKDNSGQKLSSIAEQIPDTDKVSISRTDAEKNQALALHKLSGLMKGDEIVISKENFPGALLFPATKKKMKKATTEDVSDDLIRLEDPVENSESTENSNTAEGSFEMVHRFLVVTRERFIVLDSGGKGVGATARVKSNHHLTELLKITYKKKHADWVTLYLASPGCVEGEEKFREYRVPKRKEFIEALQKNMQRFK